MAFQFLGRIRKISKKKVRTGEFIKAPSCYADYPPPYPEGTEYYEIVLERDEFSQHYNDFENRKRAKLVFLGKQAEADFRKIFIINERYRFFCTGGSGYY
ncbi:MAG: hypothetical protein NY202_02065 [Mollicutes bacterium UO1]